jgi:hypothetical protein
MNGKRIVRVRKHLLNDDVVDFCSWLMKEIGIDFSATLYEDYDEMCSYEEKKFSFKGVINE